MKDGHKACIVYCDLESNFIDLGIEICYFNPISSPCIGMAFMSRDIWPSLTDSINSHLSFTKLGEGYKGLHILKHRKYSNSVFLKHWFNKTSYFILLIFCIWNAVCFSINVWLKWVLSFGNEHERTKESNSKCNNVTKVSKWFEYSLSMLWRY